MSLPTPVFYFSLRSPYSWLAWHDLSSTFPKLLSRLKLVPFWEPDRGFQEELGVGGEAFLYTAMSKEKHLYILSDIKRLATKRGLVPNWPVDKAPVWEVPHLAWVVADEHCKGRQFIDCATRARWQHGLDICDPEVVAGFGEYLGIDPESLRTAHRTPEVRATGLKYLKACVDGGVFGVPFFVVGREKFWGIDRMQDYLGALAQATQVQTAQESLTEKPNRAIFDHPGGCG